MDDRIVLIGDAAHGTTPHQVSAALAFSDFRLMTSPSIQGAGAGQATEDALFLARLLGHRKISDDNDATSMRKAVEMYTKYRHDRAAKVQITSAQAGLLYEGRGVNGEGQDFNKVKANLDERMP